MNLFKRATKIALAPCMLATLATLATACAAPVEGDDEPIATQAQAIVNGRVPPGRMSVAAITVGSDPAIHSGVFVESDLVVTSASFIPWGTAPGSVRISFPDPANPANDLNTVATHVNLNHEYGMVALRLSRPASLRAGFVQAFSSTAPTQGALLNCVGYASARTQRLAQKRFAVVRGEDADMGAPTFDTGEIMEPRDAGVPCFDGVTGVVHAVVMSAPANGTSQTRFRVLQGRRMQEWISDMRNLAQVRRTVLPLGRAAWTPYTQPTGTTSMCMDVAGGSLQANIPVNQFTCTFTPNQRFWAMPVGTQGRFALVNDYSGKCLDVPGGATATGTGMQQFRCAFGSPNQTFELYAHPNGGGHHIIPDHARSMCVSAPGAVPNTTPSVRLVLKPCLWSFSADQRWGFAL